MYVFIDFTVQVIFAANYKDELSHCACPTAVVSFVGCAPGPSYYRYEAFVWIFRRSCMADMGLHGGSHPGSPRIFLDIESKVNGSQKDSRGPRLPVAVNP